MKHSRLLFHRGTFSQLSTTRRKALISASWNQVYQRQPHQSWLWKGMSSSKFLSTTCCTEKSGSAAFTTTTSSSVGTNLSDEVPLLASQQQQHDNHFSILSSLNNSILGNDGGAGDFTWNSTSILATQAQEHLHHLAAHDLQWYNVSGYIMDLVHLTHDVTGLSYAASIAAITVGIRLFVLLPLGILSLRVDPHLQDDIRALQKKIALMTTSKEKQALITKKNELMKRYKLEMARRIAMPVASFGAFLVMWFGLRYMVVYYPHDLATGGVLWFPDLTQHDPIFYLPIVSTTMLLMMGEVGADQLGKPSRELTPKVRYGFRFLRFLSLPILFDAPAAIFCYWIPSSSMSVVQAIILSHPGVKSAIGIANYPAREISQEEQHKGTSAPTQKIEYIYEKGNKGKENNDVSNFKSDRLLRKKRKTKRKR